MYTEEVARWYHDYSSGGRGRSNRDRVAAELLRFVRTGKELLDVGCGYGPHGKLLAATTQRLVGIDESIDLLDRIDKNYHETRVGRATDLPFLENTFDRVVTTMTSTDIRDWSGAVAEIARVLKPGGQFTCVVAHPCFAGPASVRSVAEKSVTTDGTYQNLSFRQPSEFGRGIRSKVGSMGVTLTSLLAPMFAQGLVIDAIHESNDNDSTVPHLLSVSSISQHM